MPKEYKIERKKLYEQIWSKPMTNVAEEYRHKWKRVEENMYKTKCSISTSWLLAETCSWSQN